ncbi:MAG: type IV secretion system protein TrbL [Haloarculaceae archaeon]|jgi:type IV secretion system protein TrbL
MALSLAVLLAVTPLQLAGGWPDSVAEAIWGWFTETLGGAADGLSTSLTDKLIEGLLKVPNPYESASAGEAWTGMFEISLVLLPIMIALALIAWPFSEDRESGLMDLVVRTVMVLLLIGVSQPAWSFAIDATNAVTVAILNLDPSAGEVNYGYGNGLLGAAKEAPTFALKFIVSIIAAILSVLALLLALFFLLLRWFMIWMAYIGTPFFAVVWFVGRGPFKSVGSVGATFMRMGVFSLLAGPIIAILVLTFQVIEHGAILQATGGSSDGAAGQIQNAAGEVGLIFAELALMLIFPVLLIVTIWKLISWAGKPIGAGEAAAVATMAVTAAVGGAVAGAGGSGAAASGGAASGSGGGAAAGGSSGSAAGSAAASGSGSSAGAGASVGSAGSANVGAGGSGLSNRLTARAKGTADRVKRGVHRTAANRIDHVGSSQKLDEAQSNLAAAQTDEQAARSQAKFIQNAMGSDQMEMAEAKMQGFLDAEPMENQTPKFKTDPNTLDKEMSYVGTDGVPRTVNLSQKYKQAKAQQQDADQRVEESKAAVSKITSQKHRADVGKAVSRKGVGGTARAGKFATKTGAAAMIGGVGGNSYLAYSMGRRAGQPMIGSNRAKENPNRQLPEFGMATAGQAGKSNNLGTENSEGGNL